MDYIRSHQRVEAGHRHDAYAMVVHYDGTRSHQNEILAGINKTLLLCFAIVMEWPVPGELRKTRVEFADAGSASLVMAED